MKHILKLILFIIIAVSLTGCKLLEDLPFLSKEDKGRYSSEESSELKYNIEQIVLSKGFQNIEPNIEVIKNKYRNTKILANLGLLQTSGIQVKNIVREENNINIHVSNLSKEESIQLAVPQIIIDIDEKIRNIDDINFNIVNENYKTINIKLSLNDVINKVNSEFKIASNTSPIVNLSMINDTIIWNIAYNNVFDKDNPETPLVNLAVEVDANTGNIVKSTKSFISSIIDEGHVLDYIQDKYLLYKKIETDINHGINVENLWVYDIGKNEKSLLFTSKYKIQSALFSPDLKNISLIENNENKKELYIIPTSDLKAYKVLFNEIVNPSIITWKDMNTLYIVDNNKSSSIYIHNLKENKSSQIETSETLIANLKILKEKIIITQNEENKVNKKITLTDNWENFKLIDYGFNIKFISEDKIAYLKNNEKEDINNLYIYDLKNNKKLDITNLNLSNYSIISKDELLLIEKNKGSSDFTLYNYNIKSNENIIINKVNSDMIYYNSNSNLVYVNLLIPFENSKSELIYSIDLNKMVSNP